MPLVPEFHWCQSLVPVGFNIAHVLFICRQLTPETGTGYWCQKTGQCVWPLSNKSLWQRSSQATRDTLLLFNSFFAFNHWTHSRPETLWSRKIDIIFALIHTTWYGGGFRMFATAVGVPIPCCLRNSYSINQSSIRLDPWNQNHLPCAPTPP